MTTHAIANYTKHLNLCMMQFNACCKCENDSRCSHSYLEPWWGRMATLWIGGGSLRTDRVQFSS